MTSEEDTYNVILMFYDSASESRYMLSKEWDVGEEKDVQGDLSLTGGRGMPCEAGALR